MPSTISPTDWQNIRRHFRRAFTTNLHVAIATVDAEGQPNVTPIGSFLLNRSEYSGFYFEIFTTGIPKNANINPSVCIMAVNSGKWFWLKSLLLGRFAAPPMIKIYGKIGERRAAKPEEIERVNRRLGRMKILPGGKKLFGNLPFIREIHFDQFEVAKVGAMSRK